MGKKDYNSQTNANYLKLKEILDRCGIQLVGVQYSLHRIEPLKRIFDGQNGVIFIDNEKVFKDALKTVPYREYFTDYVCRPLRTLYQERQPSLGREYRQCDIEGLFLPSPI
jgi:hypothetical protein